jgi:hypothetical protein
MAFMNSLSLSDKKENRRDSHFLFGRKTPSFYSQQFMPVKMMNQFSFDWAIKVRVTSKRVRDFTS